MHTISIIIVTLNALPALKKTIESLISQEEHLYECIIIDGKSSDGTDKYLDTIKWGKLRYFCESDSGIYNAMNKGIRVAEGEVINFIGAGDIHLPGCLFEVKKLITDHDCVAVGTCVDSGQRKKYWAPSPHFLQSFITKMPFAHQAFFVKKNIFKSNGLFDEAFKTAADYKWILLLNSEKHRYNFSNETLTVFHSGGASDSMAGINETLSINTQNGKCLLFAHYFFNYVKSTASLYYRRKAPSLMKMLKQLTGSQK